MVVMFNAKVKKFCISLLESAGSFAYTRGVMGELDTSIRSWFISSLFPLFTMPVLLPWIVLLRAEEHTRVIFLWDFVHFRAEVERLGGNRTLIEVLDQLKDWEEDWVPVLLYQIPCDYHPSMLTKHGSQPTDWLYNLVMILHLCAFSIFMHAKEFDTVVTNKCHNVPQSYRRWGIYLVCV